MQNTIITIARMYGSGGRTIGKLLAKELGVPYYDRNLIYLAHEKSGIDISLFSQNDETVGSANIPDEMGRYISKKNIFEQQKHIIRTVADKSDCVIVGRCADHILKNGKHKLLRVFVHAPDDFCIKKIKNKFSITDREAEKMFRQINLHREDYYKYHTGAEWDCAKNYDLCFDTSLYSIDDAVNAIKNYKEILCNNRLVN